jgi:hypothetical protein
MFGEINIRNSKKNQEAGQNSLCDVSRLVLLAKYFADQSTVQ